MSRRNKKLLRTGLVLAVAAVIAAVGAFSAFTSQTENPGNVVTAGTVSLTDNDGGTALYNLPAAKPGDSQTSCIRVSYTGSVSTPVKLYTPSTIGALGPNVNLQIEAGTQSAATFPSCTGFQAFATGSSVFNATLDTLPTSYANGIALAPASGAAAAWPANTTVVYRVTATFSAAAGNGTQGQTTGSHNLRWEAQTQ